MFFRKLLLFCIFSSSHLSRSETYITEENVQIDRCACAWFITRFIEPNPSFSFIKQGEKVPAGVTYDFYGAQYFHKGPDCSFTSFVKRHTKKKNIALIELNSIVNDVLAWQSGPHSISIKIKEYIDLLADQKLSDAEIYNTMMPVFDLLYLIHGGSLNSLKGEGIKEVSELEISLLRSIYKADSKVTLDDDINQLNLQHFDKKLFQGFTKKKSQDNEELRKLCMEILSTE